MNLLIDPMPVEIDGVPIHYDFRNMIRFEQLVKESALWDALKYERALQLLYSEMPHDRKMAMENLVWFYRCGQTAPEEDAERPTAEPYDFDFDAVDIAGAFLSAYGMRLATLPPNELHWWEFCALFSSLPPDTHIRQKMYYRTVDLGKIRDKHERERAQRLKQAYAIRREKRKYTLKEIEQMTIAHYGG